MEDVYDDWITSAEKLLFDLHTQGKEVVRADVDAEELLRWCKAKNLPVNGDARSKYAAEIVELKYKHTGRAT